MESKIQSTIVLEKNLEEYKSKKNRIICNEGGTGSSKTYSLAQLFAIIMMEEAGVQITITRKTMPALKATAMRDFLNVLRGMGAYREDWHNKSEGTYHYLPTGSIVDFVSVDDPMRIRSRRRDYLWLNESNEFTLEDYRQLSMRTSTQIYLDYNPSYQFHWIYDELQPKKNCVIIKSSYKDNPFLHPEIVKEIESYKDKDTNYWRIYGLGERGIAETLIYTHWQFCDNVPENPDKIYYGLDFGYNHQTALVRITEKDDNFYWEEVLYERYLTNQDLIEKMTGLVRDGALTKNESIYADNQEPARIEELSRAGFYVQPCLKGLIKDGIDSIKSKSFYITKDSLNILKEVKMYSWREKDGKKMEEPVKENDHLMDAGRYAIISEASYAPSPFPEQDKNKRGDGKTPWIPDSAGILDKQF